MTKKQIKAVERLDWRVLSDSADGVELETFDSSGGDFVITLDYPLKPAAAALYEDYDVEEEVYLYLDAKRNGFKGVPPLLQLVDAIKEREGMLEKLALALR